MKNSSGGFFKRVYESLLDKNKYRKTVKIATYIILSVVGIGMTILNVITPGIGLNDLLTYTTGIFSILTIFDLLISLINKKAMRFASTIFAFQLLAMFSIFVISGKPDGFSAIWICLLPLASMVFYGRKIGSFVSFVMFVLLISVFWFNVYQYIPLIEHLMYTGYGATFSKRFPILYLAFYLVSLLLQSIQDYQFKVLEVVNNNNQNYSIHDQLTGLFNRKGFYDTLTQKTAENSFSKIGFVIFDLDHFKDLNDKYGHLAGDQVLIKFSEILTNSLPGTFGCRWGGEEFLICYFDDQIKKDDLDNLRKTVMKTIFTYEDFDMKITCSGGVYETNDKNLDNKLVWLNKADEALYKAKTTGRNKIVYY